MALSSASAAADLSAEVLLEYKGNESSRMSSQSGGLRCRVPGVREDLPASYDAEKSAFCCKVPREAAGGPCDVVDDGGKVLAGMGTTVPPDAPAAAADKEEPQTMRQKFSALKPFVIISVSYLLYTITDGAIRMIVLLYAYNLGFSAWDVAIMFTAYELAGVFTNLAAGMMGAKWGIKTTLLTGLGLQLAGIGMLYAWQGDLADASQKYKAILYVTFAQMLCGIAKDLTKLGGKTVTKLVTPDEKQSKLFKLVSLITGWKNSLKGAGYFLGAATVAVNYYLALGVLIALILLAVPWAAISLSNSLGRARSKNLGLAQIFKQTYNVNVLSVSRFFLFGSRDMWFEVPLPFFLRNTAQGLGWSRPITGLFLAVWIIVYGQIQSWTPQLFLQPLRQSPANSLVALLWCSILVICPLFLGGMVQASPIFQDHNIGGMQAVLISGLAAFCIIFAVNSSVHSYLIVKYADGDKVAMNIGAYYAANAMGRLTGTLVSGALYSFVDTESVLPGFAACFWASAGFAILSSVVEAFLRDKDKGLRLGPCLTLVAPTAPDARPPAAKDNKPSADALNAPDAQLASSTALVGSWQQQSAAPAAGEALPASLPPEQQRDVSQVKLALAAQSVELGLPPQGLQHGAAAPLPVAVVPK